MAYRFSLSSWSVHDSLVSGRLPLLQLPTVAVAHGIGTVELCHFHITSQAPADLASLCKAFAQAGAELFGLLLDFGDITSPDDARRDADVAELRRWIAIAGELGAARVRVDAGRQPPTPEVIDRSSRILCELADHADRHGVAVSTENWHETSREPGPLLTILNRCSGQVGLCVDFGNAEGPTKYDTLAALMPRATSIHCKARFNEANQFDRDDLARCLSLMQEHNFRGPLSLINTHRDDEWSRLVALRDTVTAVTRSAHHCDAS